MWLNVTRQSSERLRLQGIGLRRFEMVPGGLVTSLQHVDYVFYLKNHIQYEFE